MSSGTPVRLRTPKIAGKQDHDGPQYSDLPQEDKFPRNNAVNLDDRGQAILWAPWNRQRGVGVNDAPSIGTTIIAGLLTFVACMFHGWIYMLVLNVLSTTTDSNFIKALIYAFTASSLFVLTMNWTWEPLLPTHVYQSLLFSEVFTFDMGILTFIGMSIMNLGGHAAGGAIVRALGFSNVVPALTVPGRWLYWALGSIIIFTHMMKRKYDLKNYAGDQSDDDLLRQKAKRVRRAIKCAAMAIFAFLVSMSGLVTTINLFYFDTGMWISYLVASRDNTDWALYVFLPWAATVTAALLYGLVNLGNYFSDRWNDKGAYPAVKGRVAYAGRKVAVF